MSSSPTPKQILIDLSPILIIYTDNTVHRLVDSPYTPPTPTPPYPTTSKDTSAPAPLTRLYLPNNNPTTTPNDQKLPILVYFHGGGFCIGSAFCSLDHNYMNILSAQSNALVISVEYRLAPEHPLPAAYEDSWSALKWVCSHSLNGQEKSNLDKDHWISNFGDLGQIFVMGDSAGGNIAHNMAMRAGSEGLPGNLKISGLILSCPYFWGSDPIGKEFKEDKEGHFCHRMWVDVAYPNCEGGIDNPMINPVGDGAPSLSGLGCGKLMVCVAGKDVLRGRGIKYVEGVKKSGWGGEVEVVEVQGEDHCFHYFDPESEKAKDLIRRMALFISSSGLK